MKIKDLLFVTSVTLSIFSFKYSSAQDTIFIYDVGSAALGYRLMPPYNINDPSDSTSPSFGVHGITSMPATFPVNTYPTTQISLLQKASDYYTTFNFPFTAVTLIRYGLNITAAIIGRRALLVFNFDVHNPNPIYWRNLSDANPFYENGSIQYSFSQLTPVRYYTRNSQLNSLQNFALVEVAEDIGSSTGYFGLAYDTTMHAYDSLLLYNLSYPNEGYPGFYSSPVNGDTLCMKYGYIANPDSQIFGAAWGGNGEYTSPFFDQYYRIHGIRWSYGQNYKISRPDFYFLKYVIDSLSTAIDEVMPHKIWNIYPNPAAKIVTINFFQSLETEALLSIMNTLGQTIGSYLLSKGSLKKELEISNLASGVYFVSIETKQKKTIAKFIKE